MSRLGLGVELRIAARIATLREVASDTARFFTDAQRETKLPAARIADEMQQILDRDRALDPPCLKRRAPNHGWNFRSESPKITRHGD